MSQATHPRLSIARCRELLGETAPARDEDVVALRDLLYGLANVVLDSSERVAAAAANRERRPPAQEAVAS